MPRGLRFCRNCGFRLGEGTAEYTETARFQNGHNAIAAGIRPTGEQQPLVTSYGLSGATIPQPSEQLARRRRKMSGMTWIFLGLLVFFLTAGVFTALFSPARRDLGGASSVSVPAPRSFFGVSGFTDAEDGVTFENVEPPGSPADKAGLVGGDVITSFDGQKVDDEDRMTELLRETPFGKTVEIVYIRDGETKTTKLTTISRQDGDKLTSAFRNRPEGLGHFGYDNGRRVEIPGSKIFGVQLGEIRQSRPADLAGVKVGDIVIEFNGVPIRTADELESRILRALPYSTVTVVVMRGTEKLEIPVKMGKQ
jgi:membrane-associated protease RseP (regulator of RpoE activity)